MSQPRLLLVGGGHAHLEILRRLIDAADSRHSPPFLVTLISLEPFHHYSGMAPGFLLGTYREQELRFDLRALADRARCHFVPAAAVALQPAPPGQGDSAGTVTLADGQRLLYDLVSCNVGSLAAGSGQVAADPRVALVKPIARVVELEARLNSLARTKPLAPATKRHLVIVGGGAAGIELAFAGAAVLDRADGGSGQRSVTLVEGRSEILPDYDQRCRHRVERLLLARGISLRTGVAALGTNSEGVRLADGTELAADLIVWLTGPEAPPLLAGAGLPLDSRGFLLVDDSLRSVGDSRVFAVGDCATLANYPETPKAGVYAVREAPILWASLLAAATNQAPPRYTPQSGFLSLLNTADGRALLRWRRVLLHARWAWRLKDRIDRRFVARYQRLT